MISIVMSYYNRLSQLQYTLKTIQRSQVNDTEIVIVDDFSDNENQLDNINTEFPNLLIRVIRMQDIIDKKYYCNPCVPYNVGLRASRGDKIVIQNPECCHMGDVLDHVDRMLVDGKYLTFHAYGCTKEDVRVLHETDSCPMFSHPKKARWYNHKTERPVAFHFCNAITRNDLIKINGFDERFSQGHNWDDAEILHRIQKICSVQFVAEPWVVHQYHTKSYGHPDNPTPIVDNKSLYFDLEVQDIIVAPNKEIIL